ncbi:AMP-binding enzyme [Candidiatus Paracoxiella cheracis]
MMQTIYGDHQRFIDTYFKEFPDRYVASDAAFCDEDGDYWIIGRTDDVINVSGHRLGTTEVESALLHNHHVAEAAVVGYPHDIKGQGIYAFVVTKTNVRPSDELKQDLIKTVREVIGPIAKPDVITWATSLPKTRSGKIMRRILRQIAAGDIKDLGDTSTLANPEVVEELITEAEEAA